MGKFLLEDIHIHYKEDSEESLLREVRARTGSLLSLPEILIWRKSLDARAKGNIHFNYSVLVELSGSGKSRPMELEEVSVPRLSGARPIVVGFGPAGIFAAYYFALAGLRPLVFERGPSMEERVSLVSGFWSGGGLDPEGNVQFGEGGAGTFSDGKLTSRSKDPISRKIREVLIAFGANPEIAYQAKPHIGTDRLRAIVPAIRAEIERLGGEVRFRSRVEGLLAEGGAVHGVRLSTGEQVESPAVLLCVGHSARDTFLMLHRLGVSMEPKPFAVGVRVEHRQELINEACYGRHADLRLLPPAEYVLTHEAGGRGCYSFCMCPGGLVVNASSEANGLVVNGMSLSRRDTEWANSALVASVKVDDFFKGSVLDGIEFQRRMEQAAFVAGRNREAPHRAPATDFRSFAAGQLPAGLPESSFRSGLHKSDLSRVIPDFVRKSLVAAMPHFERSLRGFLTSNPLLVAPETRTSSPVRICRDPETGESTSHRGLFPVGEGAGYAGGIVSAAIDGWRAAERAGLNLGANAPA